MNVFSKNPSITLMLTAEPPPTDPPTVGANSSLNENAIALWMASPN